MHTEDRDTNSQRQRWKALTTASSIVTEAVKVLQKTRWSDTADSSKANDKVKEVTAPLGQSSILGIHFRCCAHWASPTRVKILQSEPRTRKERKIAGDKSLVI